MNAATKTYCPSSWMRVSVHSSARSALRALKTYSAGSAQTAEGSWLPACVRPLNLNVKPFGNVVISKVINPR